MTDTYSILRVFAGSWALIGLFAFFLGAVIWTFRPGSRRLHDDAGRVPFRHEDRPLPSDDARVRAPGPESRT